MKRITFLYLCIIFLSSPVFLKAQEKKEKLLSVQGQYHWFDPQLSNFVLLKPYSGMALQVNGGIMLGEENATGLAFRMERQRFTRNFGLQRKEEFEETIYGIGPWFRQYYFIGAEKVAIMGQFTLLAEIANRRVDGAFSAGQGGSFTIRSGLAFFITDEIAAELFYGEATLQGRHYSMRANSSISESFFDMSSKLGLKTVYIGVTIKIP